MRRYLIEQLEHSALDFALPPRRRVVPLGTDGVDLIDEDDRRRLFDGSYEHTRTLRTFPDTCTLTLLAMGEKVSTKAPQSTGGRRHLLIGKTEHLSY